MHYIIRGSNNIYTTVFYIILPYANQYASFLFLIKLLDYYDIKG